MPFHILIIGAGAIGLTSAYALAQAGHRVSLIDQGPAGGESTWAGAGILSPLLPWDYGRAVNDLSRRGAQLWPDWAARLKQASGIDPEYLTSGLLALDLPQPAAARQWCAQHDYPSSTPTGSLAALASRPDQALWLPGVAQLRNPRLAQALVQSLKALGVTIHEHRPGLELLSAGDRIAGVRTAGELLQADVYVLAAGAWSQALLGERAAGLKITPVRGQILLFKAEPGQLACIVYRNGHYLVPRADGHILAGSTLEHAGFDKHTTPAARAELLAFARELLPTLDASRIVRQWAGLRPGSPDNVPTIGRHPELTNLYVNTGHFRYGVTMAPASAELLTSLIGGHPPPFEAAPYAWRGNAPKR